VKHAEQSNVELTEVSDLWGQAEPTAETNVFEGQAYPEANGLRQETENATNGTSGVNQRVPGRQAQPTGTRPSRDNGP
jgi:hypothetical protein